MGRTKAWQCKSSNLYKCFTLGKEDTPWLLLGGGYVENIFSILPACLSTLSAHLSSIEESPLVNFCLFTLLPPLLPLSLLLSETVSCSFLASFSSSDMVKRFLLEFSWTFRSNAAIMSKALPLSDKLCICQKHVRGMMYGEMWICVLYKSKVTSQLYKRTRSWVYHNLNATKHTIPLFVSITSIYLFADISSECCGLCSFSRAIWCKSSEASPTLPSVAVPPTSLETAQSPAVSYPMLPLLN